VNLPARLFGWASAAVVLLSFASGSQAAPVSSSVAKLEQDGKLKMAGRSLRCGNARNVLDVRLPSEGAAAPGVLIINPRLIARMPNTVRLFVFYHECGHHRVGASELRADSWAVERGVAEGWLNEAGLKQVCRSFGNAPATPTHPSARSRCQNLERVYARAVARKLPLPKRKPAAQTARSTGNPAPALVSGPQLIGTGNVAVREGQMAPAYRLGRQPSVR
jgi:hypothetical protein